MYAYAIIDWTSRLRLPESSIDLQLKQDIKFIQALNSRDAASAGITIGQYKQQQQFFFQMASIAVFMDWSLSDVDPELVSTIC